MVTGMTVQFQLKYKEVMKIYRDHPHGLKAKALSCHSTIFVHITQQLVTLSNMHRIYLCPLYDLGITFKSMLNLDNGI